MHKLRNCSLGTLLLAAAGAAAAAGKAAPPTTPAAAVRALDHNLASPRTTVLVLGTAHLSGMPENFKPEFLAPLLDKLADFRPEIITIESLSGSDCDYLLRYKATVPGAADDYCWDPADIEKATSLSVPVALAEIATTFASWPAKPTAAQRRHLAMLFLAANDRTSAVVQWLQTPAAERLPADGLNADLIKILDATSQRRNENILIAAQLAVRLGLQRVYPTDDHSADAIVAGQGEAYGKALTEIWSSPGASALKNEESGRERRLKDGETTLSYFRHINDPRTGLRYLQVDHGAALRDRSAALFGRQYLAWWQVRNLRMVANIVATFGTRPGARVLSVVGASHKPYFESYLGLMHDVSLVNAEVVLN